MDILPRAAKVECSTLLFGPGLIVMRLNRRVIYAVAAALQLPNDKGHKPLSCHQLCQRIDVPEKYVLQILRKLVIAGIVNSVRGVEGGYRLAKPLNKVSLLDIVGAVDELPRFNVETLDGLSASGQRAIKAAMAGVDEDARKRLGAFTLDRFLA